MLIANRTAAAIVLGVACSLRPAVAPAQSRVAGNYVLLATDSLSVDRLTVTDGDIGVLAGTFTSRRPLVAPATAIAAPSVRLDDGSSCQALFASTARGAGGACGPAEAFSRPFPSVADACAFPVPFPSCDPQRPTVIVPHGATVALPPGVYGDIRVEGGAGGAGTLRLSGTYGLCNLRASRRARIVFTGPSELLVAGSLAASTGVQLSPDPLAGVSPDRVQVFVAGDLVRFSRQGFVGAQVCAPFASLRLGSSVDVEGRLVAADMRLRRSIVSLPAGTPRTSTTTTSTTLPPSARCGDGIVDPGEVCDGDVRCTSPGGSFLLCSACAAFTSGPCTATTTTLPGSSSRCGDGVLDAGEQCDDGNTSDCDGCSTACTREVVGNGVVDCGEECDDGNTADCDGCNDDGEIECGNGVIDAECGEVCDGADVAGQTCAGGTVTCAADCRSVDRTQCPASAPAPREICGNCIDDDLNGLIDFEDPACCSDPRRRHARESAAARAQERPDGAQDARRARRHGARGVAVHRGRLPPDARRARRRAALRPGAGWPLQEPRTRVPLPRSHARGRERPVARPAALSSHVDGYPARARRRPGDAARAAAARLVARDDRLRRPDRVHAQSVRRDDGAAARRPPGRPARSLIRHRAQASRPVRAASSRSRPASAAPGSESSWSTVHGMR